jgi:hypothetical protein
LRCGSGVGRAEEQHQGDAKECERFHRKPPWLMKIRCRELLRRRILLPSDGSCNGS